MEWGQVMRVQMSLVVVLGISLFGASGFAQCAGEGGTASSFAAGRSISSEGPAMSAPALPFQAFSPRTAGGNSTSFSINNVPQVGSFSSGTGSLQAFQAQQMANYRALAESAVRNRRSPERQQQMLATNAARAYRAGLSAEKSGRVYSAKKQYERAAMIAPGTIAAQYAEEAISRLGQK
jgi:hypothetical protein